MLTKVKEVIEFKSDSEGQLDLYVHGRLDYHYVARQWLQIQKQIERHSCRNLIIHGEGMDYCDASGVCLLRVIYDKHQAAGGACRLDGFKSHVLYQFNLAEPIKKPSDGFQGLKCLCDWIELYGNKAVQFALDIRQQIEFIGHTGSALVTVILKPSRLRWLDTFWTIQAAGVQAFGIIALVSLLLGLILAFQSAIPLRQFGAQIFVADLVAISVARELGPLLTAIILAGRTGSAFAAELGTMKVNEELNALHTMGARSRKVPGSATSIGGLVRHAITFGFFNRLCIDWRRDRNADPWFYYGRVHQSNSECCFIKRYLGRTV